jgi:FKBP-type peptidyl-prolyl cis-trans isomerase SlyD
MVVGKDKVVSVTYELRRDSAQGEVVETVTKENPLTFLYGVGGLLPTFENNLKDLSEGEQFVFELSAEEAYGEINKDAIVNVPLQAFEINGQVDNSLLQVGNVIPMQDNTGNKLNGTVLELTDENVKMDFNHPLAGDNLYFQGEVCGIREASEEEIQHGHAHNPGGCEGCGCEHEGEHKHNHNHGGGCNC